MNNFGHISGSDSATGQQRLGWTAWTLVLASFLSIAALLNYLAPVPDTSDFAGLGSICLLMARRGLRYCVNVNWGFAHPLSCFLVTQWTGNLLVAQRLLALAGAALFLVAAERVMRTVFDVQSRYLRTAFLLAIVASPWMAEAIISLHLDVVPIALASTAIGFLSARGDRTLAAAGLLVAAGSWFRFHASPLAWLYPLLVWACSAAGARNRRALFALCGVVVGIAVPALLAYSFFGVFSVNNQKSVFAAMHSSFQWNVAYQMSIEHMNYAELIRRIDWLMLLRVRLMAVLDRPGLLLLFATVAAVLITVVQTGKRALGKNIVPIAVAVYLLLSVLPFVPLRGLPFRLEMLLVLPCFPFLAWAFQSSGRRVAEGLVLGFLVLSVANLPAQIYRFAHMGATFRKLDRDVRHALAEAGAGPRVSPDRVLSTIEFQSSVGDWLRYGNRADRYWLWSPAINYGWEATSGWLRNEFSVAPASDLLSNGTYQQFSYVLLERNRDLPWAGYDPALLEKGKTYPIGDQALLLALPPREEK
jgi:hypothetical protein